VNGRLIPIPSEGGHADFGARTDRELELVRMLREQYGRASVEHVVSGRGLLNLHAFTHRGGECIATDGVPDDEKPAHISAAAMTGRCQGCVEALRMLVAAYGAEAGNLALRGLALAGVYVGGGVAPKILPVLRSGLFMDAFRDKGEMAHLVARVPVRRVMSIALGVGARLPAFVTSMGRVLLAALGDAELEEWLGANKLRAITAHTVYKPAAWRDAIMRVRRDGHAIVAQELELGLCSIAVPVRAANGRAVAGLNVGMAYSDGVRERALKKILPALLRTRDSIEHALARSGWRPAAEARRA